MSQGLCRREMKVKSSRNLSSSKNMNMKGVIHCLRQDLETGCPNGGFIDFLGVQSVHTTNEINPI